jgi:hypothetical protein
MKKAAALLLLVLGAREALPQASVPFVSRLQARAGEASIVLSWRPVLGFTGSYRIYRHTQEINEASFPAAVEIGSVGAAVSGYEDFPPAPGAYFYAVLLDDGKLSRLFVPFRNQTSAPVQIANVAPERDLAVRITGLTAEVVEDSVRLRFQASRPDRELLLFRSLQPMRTSEDLLAASSAVSLAAGTRGYQDYPIPGLDYYYALIDAGLFKIGKPQLAEGQNSTLRPVTVPLGARRVGLPPAAAMEEVPPLAPSAVWASRREPGTPAPSAAPAPETAPLATASASARYPGVRPAPLPYLDVDAASGRSAPPLPGQRPLGPAASRAVEEILREAPPRAAPGLRIQALPEDLGAGGDSEGFGLNVLLVGYLLPGNLAEGEKQLLDYLAVRRTEAAEARARFYLGQVHYLQGQLERAVLELLMARPLYYSAVEPWLDACLLALRGS